MLSHNLWKKERKKEMEVEGNRQEIQQIQPAAKKTKYFDKYCMLMMDTHMRLRCKKIFLVVNKTKTTGECFMRKYYLSLSTSAFHV